MPNSERGETYTVPYKLYECGHKQYDVGVGGAPDRCPYCGDGVSEYVE